MTCARALAAQASAAGNAIVSTQVLSELFHTLTCKQKMPLPNAQAILLAYNAWRTIDSDVTLVGAVMEKSIAPNLSIRDAMVIEVALRAGADTPYAEDLTHGQRFGTVRVVDPFVAWRHCAPELGHRRKWTQCATRQARGPRRAHLPTIRLAFARKRTRRGLNSFHA